MIQNFFTSFLAFVSTNVDDLFILMLFYGSRKYHASHIMAGQYLGIAFLVAIGFLGAYAGTFVDTRYIGLLGFFPIYLGIRQAIDLFKRKAEEHDVITPEKKRNNVIAIATVTFANGGDNIGVYVPLLATFTRQEKIQFILVFIVMVFLWCQAAKYLASHPLMAKTLDKYSHIIMPIVLFFLGIFILAESNTLSLFIK